MATQNSGSKFTPPPRTAANTWVTSPPEDELIDKFLKLYPSDRSARYREILLRTDAKLQLPDEDHAGQAMLNAIYKIRHERQLADVANTKLHP